MKTIVYFLSKLFSVLLIGMLACQTPEANVKPGSEQPEPGTATDVGQPAGASFSKSIGPAGGAISSPDGRIIFNFPAGAISQEAAITVQPIENKAPGGVGLGYEISPKNIKLNKDAVVTWHYTEVDVDGSAPEALGLAFQDAQGIWQARRNVTLDKQARTVTVPVTRLAHWAFYEQFYMEVDKSVLAPGEQAKLTAYYHETRVDPDPNIPMDDLLTPLSQPKILQASRVVRWTINGVTDGSENGDNYGNVGQITEDLTLAKAAYSAPPKEPDTNPVALGLEVDAKHFGRIILVKTIRIDSPSRMEIEGQKDINPSVGLTIHGSKLDGILNDSHGNKMSIFFSISNFHGKGSYSVNQELSVMITPLIFGRVPYLQGYLNASGAWVSGGGTITITEYNGNTKAIAGTIAGSFFWQLANGAMEPQMASARFRSVPVIY